MTSGGKEAKLFIATLTEVINTTCFARQFDHTFSPDRVPS